MGESRLFPACPRGVCCCDVSVGPQGYFQLKANPGAWVLRLRQGRSEDIYQILA